MDNYENVGMVSQTPQPEPPVPTGGRKLSPFADSPYVMEHAPQLQTEEVGTQTPGENIPLSTKPKKQRHVGRTLLCLALAAVMVITGCGITANSVNRYWQQKTELLTDSLNNRIRTLQEQIARLEDKGTAGGYPVISEGDLSPSQVYSGCVESVVAIYNEIRSDANGQGAATTGSGFILTGDGYVVTNYHVIENASRLTVTTVNGQEYTAEVVGFDASNDISMLKIDAQGLPCVTLGSSDALVVGEQVVAIGNPLGELTSTLTVGYVSAKDRMVDTDGTIINMLQTDAAINPGNSGGPLFNMRGEVIGITTAKYSGTTSSGASIEGLGFAIPIDDVAKMLDDLQRYGYITGAYLGVMVRSMDSNVSQMYGLPMGVYVESVAAGSCADHAGIRAKDIITNLGGYEITSMTDLTRALRKFAAGDTTTVEVWRAGRKEFLSITLDEKPH